APPRPPAREPRPAHLVAGVQGVRGGPRPSRRRADRLLRDLLLRPARPAARRDLRPRPRRRRGSPAGGRHGVRGHPARRGARPHPSRAGHERGPHERGPPEPVLRPPAHRGRQRAHERPAPRDQPGLGHRGAAAAAAPQGARRLAHPRRDERPPRVHLEHRRPARGEAARRRRGRRVARGRGHRGRRRDPSLGRARARDPLPLPRAPHEAPARAGDLAGRARRAAPARAGQGRPRGLPRVLLGLRRPLRVAGRADGAAAVRLRRVQRARVRRGVRVGVVAAARGRRGPAHRRRRAREGAAQAGRRHPVL
ncbi:MAG: hypothetical protein AVDCRST_MAG30-2379, partial [uncultured Solirubrobacteraceae bacterium]